MRELGPTIAFKATKDPNPEPETPGPVLCILSPLPVVGGILSDLDRDL